MAKISIVLTQEPDPDLFRVKAFAETSQLTVGMVVTRERFAKWLALKGEVSVRVVGLTPPENSGEQPSLLDPIKPKGK
jgi:hypothetical protein